MSSQTQAQPPSGLKRSGSKHFVVGAHHRNASVGKGLNRLKSLEQNTPPSPSHPPPGFIPAHAGLAGQYGVKSLTTQADALRRSKSSDTLLRRSASGLALTGRKGSRVNLVANKRTISALTAAQPKARRMKHPDKPVEKKPVIPASDHSEEEDEDEDEDRGLSIEVLPRRLSKVVGSSEIDQEASAPFMTEADAEVNLIQQRTSSSSAPTSGTQSLLGSPTNSSKVAEQRGKTDLVSAVDAAATAIANQQQQENNTSLSAELRRGMQDSIPVPPPDGSVDSNPAIRSRFLVDHPSTQGPAPARSVQTPPIPSAAHISAAAAAAREFKVPAHSALSSSADSNSSLWMPTQQPPQTGQLQATPPDFGQPSTTAAYSPRPHLITDAEASAAAAAAAAAAVAAVAQANVFPTMLSGGASLADVAAAAAAAGGSTQAQQRYMLQQQYQHHHDNSTPFTSAGYYSGSESARSLELSLAAAAGGPAAQRELDSISKELKNVKRYRDPVAEAVERVRVRLVANSVGLGEPIAGEKMVWTFSGSPGSDTSPEQEEKNAIDFVRSGKKVSPDNLGKVLMRMWSGQWKLVDEGVGNVSSAPANTRPQLQSMQSAPQLSKVGAINGDTKASDGRATNLGVNGAGANPFRHP
ncbi:uncharacterized protein V2V93DRAFT_374245 [Kockiozyma suomiensis]|uniref:uncharacterized protein n=1 Tax=Kockiozyma suomiensis TaxID=1337062 RepID=UPI003342FC91